jgi:hypothetical protein
MSRNPNRRSLFLSAALAILILILFRLAPPDYDKNKILTTREFGDLAVEMLWFTALTGFHGKFARPDNAGIRVSLGTRASAFFERPHSIKSKALIGNTNRTSMIS